MVNSAIQKRHVTRRLGGIGAVQATTAEMSSMQSYVFSPLVLAAGFAGVCGERIFATTFPGICFPQGCLLCADHRSCCRDIPQEELFTLVTQAKLRHGAMVASDKNSKMSLDTKVTFPDPSGTQVYILGTNYVGYITGARSG